MNIAKKITIAAIIPTFRRDHVLLPAIKGLFKQSRGPDEIVVIDQTPQEEQHPEVRTHLAEYARQFRLKLVHQDQPAVSVARNLAAAEANSDILLYLDDDILPDEKLVEHHLRHYANPEIHGVSGSVFTPSLSNWVPTPVHYVQKSHLWQAFHYCERFDSPLQHVGFMYGGNFSVRRETLLKVGGWDEHILNYGDRDMGIRLIQAGYRLDFDPEAKIIHLCAPTGGTRVADPQSPWKGYQRCVSILYIAFRHLLRHPGLFVRFGLWRGARFSFLLKDNLLRPWLWPKEFTSFFYAGVVAYQWSRKGIKSPYSGTTCK